MPPQLPSFVGQNVTGVLSLFIFCQLKYARVSRLASGVANQPAVNVWRFSSPLNVGVLGSTGVKIPTPFRMVWPMLRSLFVWSQV